MAGPLDPTSAAWTTDDMMLTTGEVVPATWLQGAAENTGFLYNQFPLVSKQGRELNREQTAESIVNKAMMSAGTYMAYGVAAIQMAGSSASCDAYVSLDGTVLLQESGAPFSEAWVYGSANVVVATTGWVEAKYSVVGAGVSDWTTLAGGAIYYQKLSP